MNTANAYETLKQRSVNSFIILKLIGKQDTMTFSIKKGYNEKQKKSDNDWSWKKITKLLFYLIEIKIIRGLDLIQTYIDIYRRST